MRSNEHWPTGGCTTTYISDKVIGRPTSPPPPAPLPQKPQGLIQNCHSHGSLHVAVPSFRRGETLKGEEGAATRRLQP